MLIDEDVWECENVYSSTVIWLTVLSIGKLREKKKAETK